MKTLIMLVGNADSPFVLNELPYICNSFEKVYIFAYNTKCDSEIQHILPKKVHVYHVNVCKGWWRIFRYCVQGIVNFVPELRIKEISLKKKLAALYARGRAQSVYNYVMSVIDREKIDCTNGVIYSYWFTDQAIVAWRVAEELNKRGGNFKSVSRAHGYDLYWERNSAGYLPFQEASLRHLHGAFPCSEQGANYLAAKYPDQRSKISVARLGTCDFGVGSIPTNEKAVFITCSRLDDNKRVTLFAKAFCELWKRNKSCHWYCIGDGIRRKEIEGIISEAGAESAVTMLGNMVNEDVMSFYKQTPITYFVNVSKSEGVPVSIMEAMSFGIPVIATNVGGTSELVSDLCGNLIDADINSDSLLLILRNAINLPDLQYRRKREFSRSIWEEKAFAEKIYNNWCKLLTR